MGVSARWLGVSRDVVQMGSEAAFVPTWFLAVYVIVVPLAPPVHRLWRRFGMTSFWALVACAAVIDTLVFSPSAGMPRPAKSNRRRQH